jgi:hypothetical protein
MFVMFFPHMTIFRYISVQGQTLLYVGVKARTVACDVNIFVAKELRILFM